MMGKIIDLEVSATLLEYLKGESLDDTSIHSASPLLSVVAGTELEKVNEELRKFENFMINDLDRQFTCIPTPVYDLIMEILDFEIIKKKDADTKHLSNVAFIPLDELPKCCKECKLKYQNSSYAICAINQAATPNSEERPSWCKIRLMPEKMNVAGVYPQEDHITPSYKSGWNDCIEKMRSQ